MYEIFQTVYSVCVGVANASVLHVVPYCLVGFERSWKSLPVVSVPDGTSLQGMKLLRQRDNLYDQLDVFGALAAHFGWKSAVFIGDQSTGMIK